MNQVLHIFRKDTRRFWPEIVASIGIAAAFAFIEPHAWDVSVDAQTFQVMRAIAVSFVVLIPAGWWFLTARAVQEEGLVGDRYFWITKPYRWDRLLLAKVLLVVVFVAVPYTVAQLVMLKEAGFQAFEHVAHVARNAFTLSAAAVFPLLAMATVTSNLVRLVLTLLGTFLTMLGYGVYVTLQHGYIASLPASIPTVVIAILIAGCAMVITLQYATRRAWLARVLLFAVLPLVLATVAAAMHRQSLVDATYPPPPAGSASVMTAAVNPTAGFPVKARWWRHEGYIDLPMLYSGVADGTAVLAQNFRFTFTAPDGDRWTSPWQRLEQHVRPGEQSSVLSLVVSPEVYERFRDAPIALHVDFAVSTYRVLSTTTVPILARDSAVPGIGYCMPFHEQYAAILCRSAVTDPPLTYVESFWQKGDCDGTAEGAVETEPASDWLRTGVEFHMPLDAVRSSFVVLRRREQRSGRWQVCPGTPLTFTQYAPVGRTRAEMTVNNFEIPQARPTD